MRAFLSLFILIFCFSISKAQEKLFGEYQNNFGETLILNQDKTFEYTWKFDLASSWNVGTWRSENEKNIYLTVNEINDTLKSDNKIRLVLSSDKISNEIKNEEYALTEISGGGQSRKLPPKKLIIGNGNLYSYSGDGKIQNKKLPSVMTANVLSKPWFEKTSNRQIEKKANTKLKANELIGRIIKDISMPGNCGYIAFATILEIEILESGLKDYEQKHIPLIVKCPQFFGEKFFNKNDIYKIKISDKSKTDFGWTIPNINELDKYNLTKKLWVTDIEKYKYD